MWNFSIRKGIECHWRYMNDRNIHGKWELRLILYIFWHVAEVYWHFKVSCRPHHQGQYTFIRLHDVRSQKTAVSVNTNVTISQHNIIFSTVRLHVSAKNDQPSSFPNCKNEKLGGVHFATVFQDWDLSL